MTPDDVKTSLAKAARRCWRKARRASDLPFPSYWRAAYEWLTFHARHVGDALMRRMIDDFAVSAKNAAERGETPKDPVVPDEVRAIWEKVERGAAS